MVFILGASLLTSPTFESLPACICVVQQSLSVFVLLSCHKKGLNFPQRNDLLLNREHWVSPRPPTRKEGLGDGIARPTVVFTYLSQSLDNH